MEAVIARDVFDRFDRHAQVGPSSSMFTVATRYLPGFRSRSRSPSTLTARPCLAPLGPGHSPHVLDGRHPAPEDIHPCSSADRAESATDLPGRSVHLPDHPPAGSVSGRPPHGDRRYHGDRQENGQDHNHGRRTSRWPPSYTTTLTIVIFRLIGGPSVTAEPFELIGEDDPDPEHVRQLVTGLVACNRSRAEPSNRRPLGITRHSPAGSDASDSCVFPPSTGPDLPGRPRFGRPLSARLDRFPLPAPDALSADRRHDGFVKPASPDSCISLPAAPSESVSIRPVHWAQGEGDCHGTYVAAGAGGIYG